MAISGLWHVYLRNGVAYVPTVAVTEAGFYLDVEPMSAIPLAEHEAIVTSVAQAIIAGNRLIPTPLRGEYGNTPLLRTSPTRRFGLTRLGLRQRIAPMFPLRTTDCHVARCPGGEFAQCV